MQKVTLIRGQNGVIVWQTRKVAEEQLAWICLRDNFAVNIPKTQSGLETFLISVATHSSSLVGTITQIVQLEI